MKRPRTFRLKDIKIVRKKNGKVYLYRRMPDGRLPSLPNLPENHPDFLAAYLAAGEARPPKERAGAAKGSIAALCAAYLGSHEYRRLAPSTRRVRARVVDAIARQRGQAMVADLRARHLRKDLHELTPGAAANRLKAWRALCGYALEAGWIEADPSRDVRAPRGEVTPHRQWTDAEIEAYRARWPVETPERQAMEAIYWTAAACVDAVRLGWQMVDGDGWLAFSRQKTGEVATVPIDTLPRWAAPMEGDRAAFHAAIRRDRMLWIVTRNGRPRSVKALSQMVARAARLAGLDGCTAHGLRKARAAAIAAAGGTPSQIGAWLGDTSLAMAAHYTRQADRKAVLGATTGTAKVTKIRRET